MSSNNNAQFKRLETLLTHTLCLIPGVESNIAMPQLDSGFYSICKIVFSNDDFLEQLWDERILAQLEAVFAAKLPDQDTFGQKIAYIRERATITRLINDFFYAVIDADVAQEVVIEKLALIVPLTESAKLKLLASNKLGEVRPSSKLPSQKPSALLQHLSEDLGIDIGSRQREIDCCLQALAKRDSRVEINALVVNTSSRAGTLIPLNIIVQPGNSNTICPVPYQDNFKGAIDRAVLAVRNGNFLRAEDDVICTLGLTDASYAGDSIALAAAIATCLAVTGQAIDPYTAFTGDINIENGEWKIKGVAGIAEKLQAAARSGCHRVYVPEENRQEVEELAFDRLRIVFVSNLIEVLVDLQSLAQAIPGDSLQVRKINLLRERCANNGWELSKPKVIQNGLQFCVTPFETPELKITIYDTGTHTPKNSPRPHFELLLSALNTLDEGQISIRKIEQSLNIKHLDLRKQIKNALDEFQPQESRAEPYCDFFYKFEQGKEKLVVKQYSKGMLQFQGNAGKLYKDILEKIICLYNITYPQAKLSVDNYLEGDAGIPSASKTTPIIAPISIPLPHIGTDESGKGDYFGPMVIAGVWIDDEIESKLRALGIKDSKLISDKRCRELAGIIRGICKGKYAEVEISPGRYNELYEQFRNEGKNLNHLLAWGHARAIENILEKLECGRAVADQFGDEKYILSKLLEKGSRVELLQTTKGERYLSVAAASILARDRYLAGLEKTSSEFGVYLPKGSSEAVVLAGKELVKQHGEQELKKAVKMHHRTTAKVLGE